jgi:hypothetical protein
MSPAIRELVELLARAAYQEMKKAPPPEVSQASNLPEQRPAA